MTSRRVATVVLWAAALALAAFGWFRLGEPIVEQRLSDDLGRGEYRLTATDGSAFTEATLSGAPSAVFFGFTHCPEVCPTTLGDIAGWQEELATKGEALRVFFVTVDPERDTLDQLDGYVSWVPGTLGVSGSREEIDKAIAAFRIYAKKVPLEGGDYTMDHSAMVLLFDERGRFFEPIGYREDPARVRDKLQRLLSS